MKQIDLVQKVNNNSWFFTIENGELSINSFDWKYMKSFPFNDIIFNQTGIYSHTTNNKVFTNGQPPQNRTLIRDPYVFEVDEFLPIFRIYDQNKTLIK